MPTPVCKSTKPLLLLFCLLGLAILAYNLRITPTEYTSSPPRGGDDEIVHRFVVTKHPPPPSAAAEKTICIEYGEKERYKMGVWVVAPLVRKARTMADVGAGFGHYSFLAHSTGARVYSFERHEEMSRTIPISGPFWHLNQIPNSYINQIPNSFVDLVLIQEWYQDIIDALINPVVPNSPPPLLVVIMNCDLPALTIYLKQYHCAQKRDCLICEIIK